MSRTSNQEDAKFLRDEIASEGAGIFDDHGAGTVASDPARRQNPGSGQVAKLLNNLVFTAHLAVAGETFAFADRLGVDRVAMADVLRKGSGASFAASVVGAAGSLVGTAGVGATVVTFTA